MIIESLYPEVCNLYGDLMNAEYLARSSGAEIVRTPLGAKPAFTDRDVALVTMGSVTERGQELARDALLPYLDALRERTEKGGVTLVTGNALDIFGEYVECENGQRLPMLGFFPTHAERRSFQRYNSIFLGKFGDTDIVGFKSLFGHSYGDNGEGLFTTVRGDGLHPGTAAEGLRRNNFMATYLLGPVALLNPPFAKYILAKMGVAEPKLEQEEAAMELYTARVREFSDPKRGLRYE